MASSLQESDTARDATRELPVVGSSRRRRRGLKLVAVVAAAALAIPIGMQAADGLRQWSPFEQEVIDRSPAPLLVALQDVAQYRAATGTFQVLVDLERDTPYVPDIISGEHTTFFATGHVDAVVDFSAVGPERVVVSPDRRAVTIALPAPVLSGAVVDPAESRVVGRDRGLAERLGGVLQDSPTNDQELYVLAATKLDVAAKESDLRGRAEESTRTMLTSLTGSLGFERVTVTFEQPAAD